MDSFSQYFNGTETEYPELIDETKYIRDSQKQVLKNNHSLFDGMSSKNKTACLKEMILMIKEYDDSLALALYQRDLHEEKYAPIREAYTRDYVDQDNLNKLHKAAEEKVKAEKTKDSDRVRKQRNRALNAAKNLRKELDSFYDMYGHLDKDRINLMKKCGINKSSYYQMVDLLDIFIEEVDEQTYGKGFEMLRAKFINTPTIIGKKWIEMNLSAIFEKYEIKTTNSQIASLASQIYNT